METAGSPVDGPPLLESSSASEELAEPVIVPPPVVVAVVTRNPGAWFEETLASLRDADYPSLAVLVLDAGSDEDPTPRIASVLPSAYVRRLEGDVGFAAAANEVLTAVEGATFLVVCHDDVALEPDAIRLLVEEAYRSNAGIVGPKLVDADNPEILLEVGLAIDRFGVPFSDVEPGELDQEQHDGVRDVFFVSSAVMVARTDLFTELHGFDAETFPGAEDLDLCWRARLAGARVMVVPDARARQRQAAAEGETAQRPDDALVLRHRLRALLKSYSGPTLLWVMPVALLLNLVESLLFVASRRGVRARAVLGAWVWNLRHFGELRAARNDVQRARVVRDSELRWLQFHGSARVRSYVAEHVHAEERIQSLSEASATLGETVRIRTRDPAVIALLAFLFVAIAGSRELLFGHVPAVGSFLPWPGVGRLLGAFTSTWRSTGLGSTAPAPPAFALMAALGTALLGATGAARALLIVGTLPLGLVGAYRLARPFATSRRPAVATALVYAVNPVPRNALAGGRLGPLVFFGLAPIIVRLLLARAGLLPGVPSPLDLAPAAKGWARLRPYLSLVVLTAIATAFWPPAVAVVVVMAIALLLAAPLVGGAATAGRAVWLAVGAGVGALVLLLPWPLGLLQPGARGAASGFSFRPALTLSDVLRFHTGPAGQGVAGWALLLAAGLALLLTTGPRLVWVARAWALAVVSFAAVWVPARWAPHVSVPAPEGVLVPAALGVSLTIGLGVAALGDELRRFHFGWRQLAAIAGAVALVLPALAFAADAIDGRWRLPSTDWGESLAWMRSEVPRGNFRVLWVGNPEVLPLDASVLTDGTGYGLSVDGTGDARGLLPAAGGSTGRLVGEAIELAHRGRTSRLGHLVAPMAVRYIAVPPATGAHGGERTGIAPDLATALAGQLDLTRLESDGGLLLFENDAWIPGRADAEGALGREVPVGARDPVQAALHTDLSAATPVGDRAVRAGTLLRSQAHDARWHASADGRGLRHVRTFGWANGYVLRQPGRVAFHFAGGPWRALEQLAELALWAGVVVLWWRGRPRRRRRDRADDLAGPTHDSSTVGAAT